MTIQAVFMTMQAVLEKKKNCFYDKSLPIQLFDFNNCIDILTQLIDQKLYRIKILISNYMTQLFDTQIVTQLLQESTNWPPINWLHRRITSYHKIKTGIVKTKSKS